MRLPFHQGNGATNAAPMWVFGTGEPVRVLLIDDDRDEAILTRSLLARVKDVQYDMDWVSSFQEGLDAIGREKHDAFLVDHNLGGETGIDLVREARDGGSMAALIMLTAQRDRTTDLAAMDAGATDFLEKGRTDAAMIDRTLRYSITQAAVMSALYRSRSQMAGLEELGRILLDDGPTPESMGRIVDVIVDQFHFHRVAIYMADGEAALRLAGQRGYEDPLTVLSTTDAGVVRVRRAGVPVFLPSVNPEPGVLSDRIEVATELSVPLLVAGELVGLLNVASLARQPMGQDDYAAVRLIGDRITAALEVVRERRVADERLSEARRELRDVARPEVAERGTDGVTGAFARSMLEPMLDVAIASIGNESSGSLGVMLIGCGQPTSRAMVRLTKLTRSAFPKRPIVRYDETTLAVLVIGADQVTARAEAAALATSAQGASLDVWCGYGALAPGWGATTLTDAADAALAYAQRAGPGTVIG